MTARFQAEYTVHAAAADGGVLMLLGVRTVSEVSLMEGETFESLLKRFNRKVQQEGILSRARRHEHFEPPSVRRKKKEAAKRRKSRRNA